MVILPDLSLASDLLVSFANDHQGQYSDQYHHCLGKLLTGWKREFSSVQKAWGNHLFKNDLVTMVLLELRPSIVSFAPWRHPCIADGIFTQQKLSYFCLLGFVGSEENVA